MKNYPIIKVAILFCAGILSAQFIEIDFLFLIVSFAGLLFMIPFYKSFREKTHFSILTFVLGAILIFSAGNVLAGVNRIYFNPFTTQLDLEKNTTAVGEIVKIDLKRENELTFYLAADSIYSEEFLVKDKLNLLCKVKLSNRSINKLSDNLKPGNILKVTGFYHKGREKRNPGEFDYDAYLKSKEIVGIININKVSDITVLNSETNYFSNLIYQTRIAIDDQIKNYYPPESAALLRGLLLADRGEIDYQTKTQFINAGVVHVLAVSGLHVGYIVLIFLFLFGRFNIYLRSIFTGVGLICFMLITGVPPSVFRATVMAIVLLIAFLSNRSTNLINSISIAAVIILIINSNEIYNPGFQLSFAAVLAIGIILPYMNTLIEKWEIRNRFFRYLILFIAVSLSAQIGTLPFTLLYFNKFSIIALFTNLIVIPAIGIIIGAAIATLAFSVILPFIAIYFAAANDLIVSWILSIIKFSGNLSFAFININNYSLLDLIIFYLFLVSLLYFLPRFETVKSKVILLILIFANTFIYSSVDDKDLLPDNYLSVLMIDVGQGDSFLIKFPNGKIALVDAGNATVSFDNGGRVIIPLLNYLGIDKIDYGIVSHIDSDHYGGFVSLILQGFISEIYKPELDTSLSKDKRFEQFIIEDELPIKYFKEQKMVVGNAVLYFLNDENLDRKSGGSTNDKSGVFKLDYGKTSFLFTGDLEKKMEKYYSKKYNNFLDSDVLKVGHHGSKTSSSEEFLELVTPKISLISAGYKNKFGHPVQEVLDRLTNMDSEIFRTDLQKAILLRSDGNEIKTIYW